MRGVEPQPVGSFPDESTGTTSPKHSPFLVWKPLSVPGTTHKTLSINEWSGIRESNPFGQLGRLMINQ